MFFALKNFEFIFKIISYLVVFSGFLSLWISGGFGFAITFVFLSVLLSSWFLENTKWQISERLGTLFIIFTIPLFYIGWKYRLFSSGSSAAEIAGTLASMILILAAIKLLQKKSDKDWIFLYLISFFEVLLAAGLSISPFYLASFIVYLLISICAIVLFEIRKTSRIVKNVQYREAKLTRLPLTAMSLLILVIIFAAPLFFLLPRVGGAGLGNSSNGLSGITGFSDSVKLGAIGRLKQNDEIVMRARLDKMDVSNLTNLRWRGVALDSFDNKNWRKSSSLNNELFIKNANVDSGAKKNSLNTRKEKDFFIFGYSSTEEDITVQTIYLEPIDTPVLFALARPVAIQGNLEDVVKDSEDVIAFSRKGFDRLSYKVYSDRHLPDISVLKNDNENYSPKMHRYLQLPDEMDERISQLAVQITGNEKNRYDKAKSIEKYLQTQFGYTLEMKSKGEQPLSDFLFNVREGHCEYFATAMAIMLRTQGIETRVVNGFQQGEYNETADIFVIRQKDAHSWVEVYFPKEDVWIPFDPTPFAGQPNGESSNSGIVGNFNKYLEALETFWIQYFVSYDNQEQRSLMRSFKNGFSDYQAKTSIWLTETQHNLSDWWKEVRGDKGLQASAKAIAFGIGYLFAAIFGTILVIWLYRKIIKLAIWRNILEWLKHKNETTIVEFYERMQKVLASKGFTRQSHQTPLEFAFALNMPEAVKITEKYNRVRFGDKNLSKDEAQEIENWLEKLQAIKTDEKTF